MHKYIGDSEYIQVYTKSLSCIVTEKQWQQDLSENLYNLYSVSALTDDGTTRILVSIAILRKCGIKFITTIYHHKCNEDKGTRDQFGRLQIIKRLRSSMVYMSSA